MTLKQKWRTNTMTQQTFPAGEIQRIVIGTIEGDLSVHGWDQRTIQIEADSELSEFNQEGNVLQLGSCDGSIELRVPFETIIQVEKVDGDVAIDNVRQVRAGDIGSDASFTKVGTVELEDVGSDLMLNGVTEAVVSNIGSDLHAQNGIVVLRCRSVGSDCQIRDSANAEVVIGNVGSDLKVLGAARIQVGNIGSDCDVRDVQGDVVIGHIGSDASVIGVGGNLRTGSIGADAQFKGLHGNVDLTNVGADLLLQADFPAGSATRL